jgi:hypothetical protein
MALGCATKGIGAGLRGRIAENAAFQHKTIIGRGMRSRTVEIQLA